jgi:hypothetical protein
MTAAYPRDEVEAAHVYSPLVWHTIDVGVRHPVAAVR